MILHKNDEYDVDIIDISYEGLGVAKINGITIFIPNSITGEKVHVAITKVCKNYCFARVINFLKISSKRRKEVDHRYTQTGIAPLQHLKYNEQLKFKQKRIIELLKKQNMDNVKVEETIPSPIENHYRNKAQIPVRLVNGQIETGFYKKGSHILVPIEDFYIQDKEIDDLIVLIRNLLRKYNIEPFDELHNSGIIKNIVVRRSKCTHEIMLVLVTKTKNVPFLDELINNIIHENGDVVSIIQNINSRNTNVILSDKNVLLYGKDRIEDKILNHVFRISANSFYQINPYQTDNLYKLLIDKLELKNTDNVIDAYCGIGTIGISLADYVNKVYGIEIVQDAINDAIKNAKLNNINNIKFSVGNVENYLNEFNDFNPSVMVVDPPRKGLASEFIDAVANFNINKIGYVSCNPATLVRDIHHFYNLGYKIKENKIYPVDQFPQTPHIESVTILERS